MLSKDQASVAAECLLEQQRVSDLDQGIRQRGARVCWYNGLTNSSNVFV